VCKVFFGVITGVNRHIEVGIIQKLDLQGLRFFLGRDGVYLRHIRDGQPVAQMPFLPLSIIQSVGSLEEGTHFGVLPESGTKQEFLERKLLELWLEDLQNVKIYWSQKENLLVPIPHVQPIGWAGTENFGLSQNTLLNMSRILNSKCPKR
jgi:hypothetical protein